jgi:hypothetical protein
VTAAAKFFIWAFFLLVADQTLVIAAFKFGFPVKPTYVYAIISAGLLITALWIGRSLRPLLAEKMFFGIFFAIVLLGAVMYRGEKTGPDFGALILRPAFIPSAISYVLWPALNLGAAAGLYLLALRSEFRRTIVISAFTALVLQIVTMEADMWWPALFGDPNGRAGGLAQNANIAALLVVVLAALTVSMRVAPYAVMLAVAGVFLSQSKSGGIAALMLAICFLFTARNKTIDKSSLGFAAAIVVALAGTAYFSPVLNPSPEAIAKARILAEQMSQEYILPPATLDRPVSPEERLYARMSFDESAGLRLSALKFYWEAFKQNPFGYGTGFTNKFVTGPHNSFLKLAVDSGIFAPLLLLALLLAVSWRALKDRSPLLGSLVLIAWITAAFYHTIMVDPIVLPALAIGMALPGRRTDALEVEGKGAQV